MRIWERRVAAYHPVIGWWFIPNLKAMLRHPPDPPYLLRTNSLGMRSDREYQEKRRPGRHRVVLLGDSYTAGHGVINSARFSDLLEDSHPNLDVMNFGLSGSGTDQQLLVYETLAKPFEADAFVFAPYVSNIQRNLLDIFQFGSRTAAGTIDIFYRSKPYFTLDNGDLVLNNEPVPKGIITESEAVRRLGPRERAKKTLGDLHPLLPRWIHQNSALNAIFRSVLGETDPRENPQEGYDSEKNSSWMLMRAIIERFCRQVRGKPIFILPLPSFRHFAGDLLPIYLERFWDLHNPEENRVVVDVLPYFKKLPLEERSKCVFTADRHYSPLGHKVVAQAMSDTLAEHCSTILV